MRCEHQRHIEIAGKRGQYPYMLAMDDIGCELRNLVRDRLRECACVQGKLRIVKIAKRGYAARVRGEAGEIERQRLVGL